MKPYQIFTMTAAIFFLTPYLYSQNAPENKNNIPRERNCINLEDQKSKGTDHFVYPTSVIEQSNYEGRQYKQDMSNLLMKEISRIREEIENIEKRHSLLVQLYPNLKGYQEIVIEDKPGYWEHNEYINSRKLIALHFSQENKINCVVIDSERKNIHNATSFKKKFIRLYIPYIQSMEIESISRFSHVSETMDDATPEMQLKALRLMTVHLKEALYNIDMMISSYYNKRQKRNLNLIEL